MATKDFGTSSMARKAHNGGNLRRYYARQLDIEMLKVVSQQTESGIEHLILARGCRICSSKQPKSVNRSGDLLQLLSSQMPSIGN